MSAPPHGVAIMDEADWRVCLRCEVIFFAGVCNRGTLCWMCKERR